MVGLGDRRAHHLLVARRIRPLQEADLEARAQARQRCAQIVRDIVGDLPHACHQPLDLVEHGVEIGRQLIELVAAAGERHALAEIAMNDARGGVAHRLDAMQHVAAHDDAAGEAEAEGENAGPGQRSGDPLAEGRGVAQVAADEQAIAAGDGEGRAARRMRLLPRAALDLDREADPARANDLAVGPGREITGERVRQRVGDEIEHGVAALAGAALRDDLDEAGEPALVILLGEAGYLGVERRLGLLLDEIRGRQVDEGEQRQHRGGEEGEIDGGETEGVGAQKPRQRQPLARCRLRFNHRLSASSPRRGPCAAGAWRSPCRSSGAGARCARR